MLVLLLLWILLSAKCFFFANCFFFAECQLLLFKGWVTNERFPFLAPQARSAARSAERQNQFAATLAVCCRFMIQARRRESALTNQTGTEEESIFTNIFGR